MLYLCTKKITIFTFWEMNKLLILTVLGLGVSSQVLAGGLVTNSNQSASFVRNPARDAVIDVDAVYTNPAGVMFMPEGFHLGLTVQHPEQERNVTTTLKTLGKDVNYLGQSTRTYNGDAVAPVVPSFQAAYVMDKWSVMASFAVTGGGGKCEFNKGIGSIESVFSMLPSAATQALAPYGIAVQGYSLEDAMEGHQFYFGAQLGGAYKINEHLSVSAGLRAIIANASYDGFVRNVKLYTDAVNRTELPATYASKIMMGMGDATGTGEIQLSTEQKDLGWTPVIGVDYRINDQWNVAAKYEFRTKINLENKTTMNEFAGKQEMLNNYNDQVNKYVRDDVPATLTLGVQYSPVETLRFSAGFHLYDDTHAIKSGNEHELIDRGTLEFLLGAEWDITESLTASVGWQNTNYALSDAYMKDMAFNCSSNMMACGIRYKFTEKVSMDLGYMQNFYQDKTVVTSNYKDIPGLDKTDTYSRKNMVFAVGLNMNF